jgi:wyosine [tRNA(Phe)-imidazoG37] synthetase (radical SAM superfamily)
VEEEQGRRVEAMIAFGPIPSRRLGRSLGLNIIPPKVCTYSCVYCQVGLTSKLRIRREDFYSPEMILQAVEQKVNDVRESIDFLTFVPDGEPTLDRQIGRTIGLLKQLGIRIAVITNASLLWREDVKHDLQEADWVSLKVDSVKESVWRRINRPHRSLRLSWIMDSMLKFAATYRGELNTETMLVRTINDRAQDAEELAVFLSRLAPEKAYLSAPTRPPAEPWVLPPTDRALTIFYQVLSKSLRGVELLVSDEGNEFVSTGNAEEDLLNIVAVHPMREEAVGEFLTRAHADWSQIERLLERRRLLKIEYAGTTFYTRPLPRR